MNRELLQQAIATIGYYASVCGEDDQDTPAKQTIKALRQELEKPEPEPVGYQYQSRDGESWHEFLNKKHYEDTLAEGSWPVRAIYAAPIEPNCKFPTCHSQEYQDKLVQEILWQEPVAYMLTTRNFGLGGETWDTTEYRDYQWDCDCVPLYTK